MNNRPDDGTLGQIVGSVSSGGTSCYAARFTPGLGVVSLGWLKNPGSNPIGVATEINDLGQVAGYTTTSGGTAMHAFRYTDGKGMKDLGTLAGLNTKAFGINSSGDVVLVDTPACSSRCPDTAGSAACIKVDRGFPRFVTPPRPRRACGGCVGQVAAAPERAARWAGG